MLRVFYMPGQRRDLKVSVVSDNEWFCAMLSMSGSRKRKRPAEEDGFSLGELMSRNAALRLENEELERKIAALEAMRQPRVRAKPRAVVVRPRTADIDRSYHGVLLARCFRELRDRHVAYVCHN